MKEGLRIKKKVEDLREEIFETDNQVYEGDSDGSKVLVEFFDYNCSYCKRVHEDLKTVLKNLRHKNYL